MKIRLITKKIIEDYAAANPRSRSSFAAWLTIVKYAHWDSPPDIRKTFRSANILGNGSNRIVFNINRNNYCMICKYVFAKKYIYLFIYWIGTRGEYAELCESDRPYITTSY